MNTSLTPATRLSRVLTDWLRPDSLLDREFFDLGSTSLFSKTGVTVPSVNIRETVQEWILEVAAPGLQREDFQIEVENHTLIISAEKEEEKEENKEKNGYTRREYSYNSFTRSFVLPENIKEGEIDARYDKGVLTVTVPKVKDTATKQAKKISVS